MTPAKDCPECGCPMLPRGQRRKGPHDYRHARGCPRASKAERAATEKMWADLAREESNDGGGTEGER